MRVKFARDYPGGKGELPYAKNYIVDLDAGQADQLIAAGFAKAFPRTDAENAEQALKVAPGQTVAPSVLLQGDTRQATEDERGDDDPHVVRKADEKAVADVAAAQAKAADAERVKAEKATADARSAAAKDAEVARDAAAKDAATRKL
jgi:hypothetical protein